MFDIGFSELVLIGVLALLVLGPKRLPEVARTAGRWMSQVRRFVGNVKQDFDREIEGTELSELRKLKHELDETRRSIAESGGQLMQRVADSGNASKFPHPDDPVTGPVILPSSTTTKPEPGRKTKARRSGKAGVKTAGKHDRRPKARKRH